MKTPPLRILLVDDDEDEFILTRDLVDEIPVSGGVAVTGGYELSWTPSFDEALAAMTTNRYDAYLVDYQLGERDGLELLQQAKALGCRDPIIILTGQGDRNVDLAAMKAGASDFLVKRELSSQLLERSIRYARDRKVLEAKLEHLAQHDALTGLPNRRQLELLFERARAYAQERGKGLALFFLDLNKFKSINDTLGHAAGDELLVQVASRLHDTLRSRDLIARLGGDEFAVLLNDVEESGVGQAADRILAAFSLPFRLEQQDHIVGASIGMTLYPKDGEDFSVLLRRADQAMYRAKVQGDGVAFFDSGADQRLQERRWLAKEFAEALEGGGLELSYQPIIDLDSGGLAIAEAVPHWRHPERGVIPRDLFIPIAEDSGLIVPLDRWVLREASRRAQEGGFVVSVDLSPFSLRDPDLPDYLASCLHDCGLEAGHLIIEITEQGLEQARETQSAIDAIHALGVKIALDDFGTGNSSLAYLTRLPLDILKIDRSFVKALGEDAKAELIANTIISLAHSLNLVTVADGVETEAQLAWLAARRCQLGQGPYFALPQPFAGIRDAIARSAFVPAESTSG